MSLEPDMSAGCDCGHPQPASPLGHLLSCAVWRWHTGLPAPELQPTTCTHPDGHEGECPCPPGCACCQVSATTAKPTPHAYLSTGCHHGRHDYCKAMIGWQGEKRPATCKFCQASCQCGCHDRSTELPVCRCRNRAELSPDQHENDCPLAQPTTARVAITVTAPPRDAPHHARTITDLIQAEYGDTMRLDIRIDRQAATEATETADRLVVCGNCYGSGYDPEDPGDYDTAVHQCIPGTRQPCPECIQKGLPPRLTVADATGYCPHCGRGDCAPTADQYEQLRQRAEEAEDERDQLRVDLNRQAQELATWRATVATLDSGAPGTPRHRAEQAESAMARVRDVIDDMEHITGARHWASLLTAALEEPSP